ncbi:MAG: nucleotidyltransferase [bacterium]|nr:nucleotidyltransferase [bacterium]
MSYVGDAFVNLKQGLEITDTEQQLAQNRRQAIYDHIDSNWDITRAFLTGSYGRHTKTKKLKDVDIFVEIDPSGSQAGLRHATPASVLADLAAVLEKKYPNKVRVDVVACVVDFGADEITSFEIVPAFARSKGGFEIPDTTTGGWLATDPERHAEAATEKNAACDSKWVPLVKMIKGINRENGEPINPSFLIEVMALALVRTPFGRYQDEISGFLASAADQIQNDWPDPAGLGPAVNRSMNTDARSHAADHLRAWQLTSEKAIDLEDGGSDRAAVEKWRELFGSRMPRPQ